MVLETSVIYQQTRHCTVYLLTYLAHLAHHSGMKWYVG